MIQGVPGQKAVFVTSNYSLASSPGGVQLCTIEYQETLRLAGWELHVVGFDYDDSIAARIRRRLLSRPYQDRVPVSLVDRIVDQYVRNDCSAVFLNECEVVCLAGAIRQKLPSAKLVFLSHGLDSVDYLHALRSRGCGPAFGTARGWERRKLARQLIAECKQRQFLDATICLSDVEVEIERWLGAPRATWVPRSTTKKYLDWTPVIGRAGFVGTLDHPPNAEGIILFLKELEKIGSQVRVRVAGGPPDEGRRLSRRFPNVDYLGTLTNEQLQLEAATWCCFLHPLFCYAKGASTKLAVGISWGIPVVTTAAGRRGYIWDAADLIQTSNPAEFAAAVNSLCYDRDRLHEAQAETRRVCETSPKLDDVATKLREFLSIG